MKQMMLTAVTGCALALSMTVHAQEAKEHSMTGCLTKADTGDTYMLTNVEGKGPKSVAIVSSSANLAPHVGHKVEITGTAESAKEATDKNLPKAPHYMKVTAVKMISTTCP